MGLQNARIKSVCRCLFFVCHSAAQWRNLLLPCLLIPLAALLAVLPLLHNGPSSGHDFDFHLLNWMEAARQFSHGNLHPHWAFTPAYNAGEPRFVFYPPISWTLGALLGLLLTHLPGVTEAAAWTAAPILYTWLALTLSGLALHRLARLYASRNAALIAATLYLANPYMLFTAYERTAYAELLAAAVIPLLLLSILSERVTIPRIAVPVALLWLTNAPAAVMGCYTLAFLALLRLVTEAHRNNSDRPETIVCHSDPEPVEGEESPHFACRATNSPFSPTLRFALKTLAGTALGLSLAAFYILPATLQRRFVQIAMATSVGGLSIRHNFLFAHTGFTPDALFHDTVLRTASWIAVLLLAATSLTLAAVYLLGKTASPDESAAIESDRQSTFPTLPLALLTAGIAFLLTPLSLPLWNHTPQALFLQFPWRLLAILAPILAISIARALTLVSRAPSVAAITRWGAEKMPGAPSIALLRWVGGKKSVVSAAAPGAPSIAVSSRWVGARKSAITAAAALLLAAALVFPAYHRFRQPIYPEDAPSARLALFHSNLGVEPTDEYTPVTADNDALSPPPGQHPPTLPRYWLATTPDAPAPSTADPGPAPMRLNLTLPRDEFLILNLRDYPAWHITRNGSPMPHPVQRDDGLLVLSLPAGFSTLDIRYARLPSETAGDALTLLALILLLVVCRRTAPRS